LHIEPRVPGEASLSVNGTAKHYLREHGLRESSSL
jgi:hypothetical protein